MLVLAKSITEVLDDLNNIQPGQKVICGQVVLVSNYANRSAMTKNRRDEVALRLRLQELDDCRRIMVFYERRQSNNLQCVAVGVHPNVRLRLETVLKRIVIPLRTKQN